MSQSSIIQFNRLKKWCAVLGMLAAFALTGCATSGATAPDDNDPLEKMNRTILKINLKSDRILLKPVARAYSRRVPRPVRTGVSNFFANLWEPMTVTNDLLQGKFAHAARDASRFVINSTLGLVGIFDVASSINLPRRREDFGQTLAVWGVPSGPYLVLPLFGPSNLRDTAGLAPQMFYADPLLYTDASASGYASAARLVDARARLLGADDLLDVQPDKYLFLRETYRQRRRAEIADGHPPADEAQPTSDELIDQLLEE